MAHDVIDSVTRMIFPLNATDFIPTLSTDQMGYMTDNDLPTYRYHQL